MRRLTVGLTGGLASGKSTVSRLLAEAGCFVVDADQLVAELYSPGEAGAEALGDLLGNEVLTSEGAVDHRKVAAEIFSSPQLRTRVEAAIHPLVRERFQQLAASSDASIVVLEATLLVEAGYRPDFDYVVTVEADEAQRLARAVARGMSREDAKERLIAQGDGEGRRSAADAILRNDGTLDDLHAAVNCLLKDFEARLRLGERLRLVTGNPNKLIEARRVYGGSLEAVDLDLPEIQSMDMLEVLQGKADAARELVDGPFVVEEAGLELRGLNGFPGPLVKWMLQAIGPQGIAELAIATGDPRATARSQLLYRDGDREVVAEGFVDGVLVSPPRGSRGFGWDPIFQPDGQPDGEGKTSAEMSGEEKDQQSHRGRAWRRLIALLAHQG